MLQPENSALRTFRRGRFGVDISASTFRRRRFGVDISVQTFRGGRFGARVSAWSFRQHQTVVFGNDTSSPAARTQCPRGARQHVLFAKDRTSSLQRTKCPLCTSYVLFVRDAMSSLLIKNTMSSVDRTQCRLRKHCLLYTSPSPRDKRQSRMPSSA